MVFLLFFFSNHSEISIKKYPGSIIANAKKMFQILLKDKIRVPIGASDNRRFARYNMITKAMAPFNQIPPIVFIILGNLFI